MLPGMDPRAMKAAMKKMGVKQEDIPAEEVIIRTPEYDIVVKTPSVQKIEMMGQESFQVSGEIEVSAREVEVSQEDVNTVMSQASVSEKKAREALTANNGDLAAAILNLQG